LIRIIGDKLRQYDLNRQVELAPKSGLTLESVSFQKNGPEPLVTAHREEGGMIVADIPNILLKAYGTLTVECYLMDADGYHISEKASFTVCKRDMPADYEYVATPVLKLGAGGASSWNDLTDKPFGEEVRHGALVDSQTAEVNDGYSELYNVYGIFKEGNTYTIVFDGVTYECVAWYHNGYDAIVVGNGTFVEADGIGEDVPFAIGGYASDCTAYLNASNGTHTVEVQGEYWVTKKIDENYLPNDVMIIRAIPSDPFYDGEDGAEIELSKTGSEIFSAWHEDGKSMIVTGIEGLLPVTAVYDENNFLCHGLVGGEQMRAVGYRLQFDGTAWKIYKNPPFLCDMQFGNLRFESSDFKMYKLDVDDNGNVIAVPEGGSVPS
jgi:hypothetical protein